MNIQGDTPIQLVLIHNEIRKRKPNANRIWIRLAEIEKRKLYLQIGYPDFLAYVQHELQEFVNLTIIYFPKNSYQSIPRHILKDIVYK